MDAVPGRYTTTWFEATKPGVYHLFCAEYCGTEHSRMIGRIVVQEPAEYQAWLSAEQPPAPNPPPGFASAPAAGAASASASPVAAGEALFQAKACATCHLPQGGGLGPSLVGLFGSTVQLADGGTATADEAYLHESIINPLAKVVAGFKPVMPTFRGQISEDEIFQLIQYIKSLRRDVAGAATSGAPAS
jgi:cytochrome c oxidase subunit 2